MRQYVCIPGDGTVAAEGIVVHPTLAVRVDPTQCVIAIVTAVVASLVIEDARPFVVQTKQHTQVFARIGFTGTDQLKPASLGQFEATTGGFRWVGGNH